MLFLALVAPIIQLTLLGYAATLDLRHIPVGIVDPFPTRDSLEIADLLRVHETFSPRIRYYPSPSALEKAIQEGVVRAGIIFPPGFSLRKQGAKAQTIQALLDATNANTAQIVAAELRSLLRDFQSVHGRREGGVRRAPSFPIPMEVRIRYNPELKSQRFMVPGVLVMVLLISTTILTAMSIVKEKELGTMEALLVSPLKPMEVIAGKLLPFITIAFLQFTLVILALWLIFGITIKGSLLLLYALGAIFLLTSLGFGLMVSVLTHTQQQAMSLAFFILLPMIILSGFLYPLENMPVFLERLSLLNPLRYFLAIIRALVLKGASFWELWEEAAILLLFGIAFVSVGILRFRRTLE